VLLLVNVLFFAWSQGWVDALVGVRANGDREPERLQKQVHPEAVRVLTTQAVAAAASAAESRLLCFEAGPFDDGNVVAVESSLASALPAGAWVRRTVEVPARWIVYMGRYPNRETMQKKEQELARIKVPYDEIVGSSSLEPGLSLGQFPTREGADAALQRFTDRGLHTGRVLQLAKASSRHMLRVERADQDIAGKVTAMKLDTLGKGFVSCSKVAVTALER